MAAAIIEVIALIIDFAAFAAEISDYLRATAKNCGCNWASGFGGKHALGRHRLVWSRTGNFSGGGTGLWLVVNV